MENWLTRQLPMRRLVVLPVVALGLLLYVVLRERALTIVERSIVQATVVSTERADARRLAVVPARRALVVTARLDGGGEVRVPVSEAAAPAAGESVTLIRLRYRDGSERFVLNTAASLGEAAPLPPR